MEVDSPFRPAAPLFAMAASPSANPPASLLGSGLAGDVTIRVYNSGPGDVFFATGPTSAAASAGAVIPLLSGNTALPLPAAFPSVVKSGETRGFTRNGQFIFAAAIQAAGSSTVFAQAGFGFGG